MFSKVFSVLKIDKRVSMVLPVLGLSALTVLGSSCKKRGFNNPNNPNAQARSTNGATVGGFDTNDVSFLFPAPKDKAEADLLIPLQWSSPKGTHSLLSKEAFQQVMAFAQKGAEEATDKTKGLGIHNVIDSANTYEAWRLVSMRIIPCGDSVAGHASKSLTDFDAQKCTVHVRLVVQPLNSEFQFEDNAFHLIYKVKESATTALPALAKDLEELKQLAKATGAETNGVPLGVHPALKGNLRSDNLFLQRLTKFVTERCDYMALEEMAVFLTTIGGAGRAGTQWHFFSVLLDPANTANPMKGPIPTNEKGEILQTQNGMLEQTAGTLRPDSGVGEMQRFLMTVDPQERTPPDIPKVQKEHEDIKNNQIANLLRIQDPTQTPIVTFKSGRPALGTDCVSCHRSTPALLGYSDISAGLAANQTEAWELAGQKPGSELPFLSRGFKAPEGVTGFAEHRSLSKDPYDFRNFGWAMQGPESVAVISRYTVNESALVAHQFNTVIRSPAVLPPVALVDACKAGPKRSELESCLYHGGGLGCYDKLKCR